MIQKPIKTATLQFYLVMFIAYLCCCATSTKVFAKPTKPVIQSTKYEQKIITLRKDLKSSQKEFEKFILKQNICPNVLPLCLNLKDIAIARKHYLNPKNKSETKLLEFSLILDLKKLVKLSELLLLSKNKQRRLIQQASLGLSKLSLQWFKGTYKNELNNLELSPKHIAINNSVLILNSNERKLQENSLNTVYRSSKITIGILDSGVSVYHQQMTDVDVTQYNPKDQSLALRDTAFGHGSGILSLLGVAENKRIKKGYIKDGKYFSCNGLPKGKFNAGLILQCMNWFFLQPKVDVIINAWLATEPGCKNEWLQPIEALLASNTVPVFAAGNYAQHKKGMNFSPANLILDNTSYPLLTVGALTNNLKRLSNSSYDLSSCNNLHSFKHYQANIFAKGEKLKVAIPFSKQTYQIVSGTSYSIVEVAAATAKLMKRFPKKSNQQIIEALFNSATPINKNSNNGYGRVSYQAAIKLLSL